MEKYLALFRNHVLISGMFGGIRKCAILTAWGESYGMGHFQRMLFLSRYLEGKGIPVSLVVNPAEPLPPKEESNIYSQEIPEGSDLIIRDRRDSTRDEIESLMKKAPVIVIDDCGEGRSFACGAIDCLPDLEHWKGDRSFKESPFLFGLTFAQTINDAAGRSFDKDIDLCVYTGHDPSDEYRKYLLAAVPGGMTAVLCDGSRNLMVRDGKTTDDGPAYPEALLRSKILLTHYGVTLFEGKLCGCALATVNPTTYHDALADRVRNYLGMINFGLSDTATPEKMKKGLKETIPLAQRIDVDTVRRQIVMHTDLFIARLEEILA
jgi:hypothetical protein